MATVDHPHSTAVNSNGGTFHHGGRDHLDLSTLKYGKLSGFDRARYESAAVDSLLDAAAAAFLPTKPKPKPWFAPGGIGHIEDEHQPGGARRAPPPKRRRGEAAEAVDQADERPAKRARVPSRRAREANGSNNDASSAETTSDAPKKRATRANPPRVNTRSKRGAKPKDDPALLEYPVLRGSTPAENVNLYLMSGALQDSPLAAPAPTTTVTNVDPSSPTAADTFAGALGLIVAESAQTALGPEASVDPAEEDAALSTTAAESAPTPPKLEASTNTSCVGSVVSPSNAPSKRASGHATTEGRVTKSRATPKAQPTTASDSDVPPAPGMVRGARGKWVYEKGSSKMTKAWITRRKNGTSGRRGGAPLADTVRKNKAKGVDYGSAVNA